MTLYNELKELVNSLEADMTKFYEKGNKTAGVRVRVNLQKVRELSKELRFDISRIRKEREAEK